MDGDGQLVFLYKKHMETWHLFNPYCVQEVFPSQHALFAQHENEFMIYIALFFLFFFFLYIQRTDPEVIKADGENIVSRCFGTYTICMKKRDMGGSAKIEIK